MRGYIAVGHGIEPNGVFDPGAVVGTTREYDLAFTVVSHVEQLLSPYLSFTVETNGGPGHDPDYRGSVDRVNNGGYDWAIELHFDEGAAPRGGLGLWLSPDDQTWCDRIERLYGARGLPTRGLTQRPNLYFLNGTRCPSIIWECDRVGPDVTVDQLATYAECVAKGTLDFIAWKWPNYRPTPNPQPSPQPAPFPTPTPTGDDMNIATNPHNGNYWVLTGPDGGVNSFRADGSSGPYFGNLVDHPEYNAGGDKPEGPAIGIAWVATTDSEDGYVIYTKEPGTGTIHAYHFDESTVVK